jgi:DNA-binding transcriptional MerR regulator
MNCDRVSKSEASREMKISRQSVIRYARQGLISEDKRGAVLLSELRKVLKTPGGGRTGKRPRRLYRLTVRGIARATNLEEREVRRRLKLSGIMVKHGLNIDSVRAVLSYTRMSVELEDPDDPAFRRQHERIIWKRAIRESVSRSYAREQRELETLRMELGDRLALEKLARKLGPEKAANVILEKQDRVKYLEGLISGELFSEIF